MQMHLTSDFGFVPSSTAVYGEQISIEIIF